MKIKITKSAVTPEIASAIVNAIIDQLTDQKLDVHSATLYVNVCTSSLTNPKKIVYSDKGKEVAWTVTQRELTDAREEGLFLDRILYDENGCTVGYLYREIVPLDDEPYEEEEPKAED